MKTLKLLPYFFAVLSLASCSKKDNDPAPGAPDCQVTRIISTEDGNTEEIEIDYDSEGRLTKAAMSGGDIPGDVRVKYTGNQPTSATIGQSIFTFGRVTYTYDTQNRLVKHLTDISLLGTSTEIVFEYDSQNRISKAIEYAYDGKDNEGTPMGGFTRYTTFTYDAQGNITRKSFHHGASPSSAMLTYTIDYTYDNAPNPSATMEMLLTGYSTPNNVLTAVQKEGNTVIESRSFTTEYQYNALGFPTQAIKTTQTGQVTTTNLTYNCR